MTKIKDQLQQRKQELPRNTVQFAPDFKTVRQTENPIQVKPVVVLLPDILKGRKTSQPLNWFDIISLNKALQNNDNNFSNLLECKRIINNKLLQQKNSKLVPNNRVNAMVSLNKTLINFKEQDKDINLFNKRKVLNQSLRRETLGDIFGDFTSSTNDTTTAQINLNLTMRSTSKPLKPTIKLNSTLNSPKRHRKLMSMLNNGLLIEDDSSEEEDPQDNERIEFQTSTRDKFQSSFRQSGVTSIQSSLMNSDSQKTLPMLMQFGSGVHTNKNIQSNDQNQLNIEKLSSHDKEPTLVFENKRLVHNQILKEFEVDLDKDIIVKRCTENQVIVDSEETQPQIFENEQDIEKFLKQYSKTYNSVFSIQLLGKGGESIVFRIETQELEELVVKCPRIKKHHHDEYDDTENNSLHFFNKTLYENQMLKVRAHREFTAIIKEEVIEYNKKTGTIIRYATIIERAQNDLATLVRTWLSPDLREKKREYYSKEKLAYYCFQSMKVMNYLHSRNIYFGDMKPENLLIFRNQLVKIDDVGISIKLHQENSDIKGYPHFYMPKGYSRNYALPFIYELNCLISRQDLYKNDRFALWKTFRVIYKRMKRESQDNNYPLMEEMLRDLMIENKKFISITEVVQKYTIYFSSHTQFAIKLCEQMKYEYKTQAIREILQITYYKNIIMGLYELSYQQYMMEQDYYSPNKSSRQKQNKVLDKGEKYDPLLFIESEEGVFQNLDQNLHGKDHFLTFPKHITTWDLHSEQQQLNINDNVWKQIALLLMEASDDKNEEEVRLKQQLYHRTQNVFKIKEIFQYYSLEAHEQQKRPHHFSDEDLNYFFKFMVNHEESLKVLGDLEKIFKKNNKNTILLEILHLEARLWFKSKYHYFCELNASKCIKLAKTLNKKDVEIDCQLMTAMCNAKSQSLENTLKLLADCQKYIELHHSKYSLPNAELLSCMSKLYQDKNIYDKALQFEEQCLDIYYNLFGDSNDKTLKSYYRTGMLQLKLQNFEYNLHPRLNITQIKVFLPLIESYVEFNEIKKIQEVIQQIKEEQSNHIFLAFISEHFKLNEQQIEVLTEDEDIAVLHSIVFQSRRHFANTCIKYDTLFLGAMKYCDEKIKKLDKVIWNKNIKLMVDVTNNYNNYDKLKKHDFLVNIFELLHQSYKSSHKN